MKKNYFLWFSPHTKTIQWLIKFVSDLGCNKPLRLIVIILNVEVSVQYFYQMIWKKGNQAAMFVPWLIDGQNYDNI